MLEKALIGLDGVNEKGVVLTDLVCWSENGVVQALVEIIETFFEGWRGKSRRSAGTGE
jgi:hypothetical protein